MTVRIVDFSADALPLNAYNAPAYGAEQRWAHVGKTAFNI